MDVNDVPLSPLSFLSRAADVFGERVGFVRPDGTEVSYRQMRDRAHRLADRLRTEGVGHGDTVGVLAPNDLTLLESHYGVPASGAALVALNVRLAAGEYRRILDHAGCKVLIVDQSLATVVAEVVGEVASLVRVIEVTDGAEPTVGQLDYEMWLASGRAEDAPLPLPDDENAPIAINYTSGTTGDPKGVIYSHRGAYLNAMGQALQFRMDAGSVYLWTLPMFHCNGWCFTWAVTAVAATHIGTRRFDPGATLDAIGRHRVTHLCGAPIILNELANHPSAAGRSFEQSVLIATGGAPPSPTTIASMEHMGFEVVHLYGLTETYGPSLVCEPQPAWKELDSGERAGRMARQGVRTVNVDQVRVVDDQLCDVPADGTTMGEIVVRSNSVMRGYRDAPEATAAAFRGGWFHTADLAVRHPDGYIEIRDRAKDVIISGGENISSIEVENVIASHPDVAEVAVVGRPDERWGESPVAFVLPRSGRHPTHDDIVEHVRARLAGYKAPREVHFRELPKTSTGKIRKSELRSELRGA